MLVTLKHCNCFSDKRLSSPSSHMCTLCVCALALLGPVATCICACRHQVQFTIWK